MVKIIISCIHYTAYGLLSSTTGDGIEI